jgi:hypothetical protein
MSDLWKVIEINHKVISSDSKVQNFDARFSDFLKSGPDTANIERVRTTHNGRILAAGSLGWHSLKSTESQKLSDVIALPLTSKEIVLTIVVPYSKLLSRDSETWINWTYNQKTNEIATEICSARRHCAPVGSKEYKLLLEKSDIRYAYDESAYVL